MKLKLPDSIKNAMEHDRTLHAARDAQEQIFWKEATARHETISKLISEFFKKEKILSHIVFETNNGQTFTACEGEELITSITECLGLYPHNDFKLEEDIYLIGNDGDLTLSLVMKDPIKVIKDYGLHISFCNIDSEIETTEKKLQSLQNLKNRLQHPVIQKEA